MYVRSDKMASEGTLIVYAFLANESIPVEKAVVTVTAADGDKTELLGVRLTNSSGRTEPIKISTPDVEYSLEPQNTEVPFTSVDVRVDHPAAYTVATRNVQIFPGQVSLENVRLIPLEDNVSQDNKTEYVDITPQNL